jgi:hypothetical protein
MSFLILRQYSAPCNSGQSIDNVICGRRRATLLCSRPSSMNAASSQPRGARIHRILQGHIDMPTSSTVSLRFRAVTTTSRKGERNPRFAADAPFGDARMRILGYQTADTEQEGCCWTQIRAPGHRHNSAQAALRFLSDSPEKGPVALEMFFEDNFIIASQQGLWDHSRYPIPVSRIWEIRRQKDTRTIRNRPGRPFCSVPRHRCCSGHGGRVR